MSNGKDLLDEIKNSEEKTLEVLDGILETLDVLNNPEDINLLKKSLQDIEAGRILPLKTLEGDIVDEMNSLYALKCTTTFNEALLNFADDVKKY